MLVYSNTADNKALVITGTDKFFCTGYDLQWLRSLNSEGVVGAVNKLQRLLARYPGRVFVGGRVVSIFHLILFTFLVLECPTIAAINGHCFGGGGLWSMCLDYR